MSAERLVPDELPTKASVVDRLLAWSRSASPGAVFTVVCSTAAARWLPQDPGGADLHRYRGVLVTALLPDDATRVELVPLDDRLPTYVGDLTTGDVALRPPG